MVSDFVERNLSAKHFNGGILVAKNGVPVFERYTGFSNLRTKDSMTAETPLQIASTGRVLVRHTRLAYLHKYRQIPARLNTYSEVIWA